VLSSAFMAAVGLVLRFEGGFTADPQDPGNWTGGTVGAGELKGTKYGVSAASFPGLDIAALTRDEAIQIYHRDYWTPLWCEQLPPPLAIALFDGGVNQGVGTAIRMLQRALRVTADGIVGPETLLAAQRTKPTNGVITEFLAQRAIAYAKGQPAFHHTWYRRLFDLHAACMAVA
jgi:lysozyme family protein